MLDCFNHLLVSDDHCRSDDLTETRAAVQDPTRARRLQLKRRAKHGLVATYIHEISGRRRNGTEDHVDKAVQTVAEPATPAA
jgi:hypothetical protein